MVYYLGRDVKVYIANESAAATAIYVHDTNLAIDNGDAGAPQTKFANPRSDPMAASGQVTDLTGVDLGIGATDEDISFMGLRSVLKAEIKKETSLTLTRKKKDSVYDVIFNGDGVKSLRWGCSGDLSAGATTNAYTGLEKPTVNYGYRLHIQLKSSGEIFCIRNATITGHTVSLNVDGVTEETLEFMSHVDPKIVTSAHTTGTLSTEL
tara:strand:+ start:386 stop:1009 length:624 start_codon:yes stop_codon:yes gene_type:complete